jgi:hypothetical protein
VRDGGSYYTKGVSKQTSMPRIRHYIIDDGTDVLEKSSALVVLNV